MTDTSPPLDRDAAMRVHYTDPRVRALAAGFWRLTTGGTHAGWLRLGKDNPDALIEEARDWLRAAVALGLLPLIDTSTGKALTATSPDVDPRTGCPVRDGQRVAASEQAEGSDPRG